ncbi:MAE_28990/MAE_18760 family HEPN-like nuclease [Novosphingobium capsulatum]|uniref:MAE_28990/MAE_18760 family HEPN-like nuclease n=1 Tax=Novosphingobium capsulatum TaxID=13688 RepID=UPI0009FD1C50|nr:MAE_28990/MAE_18760 family HEPN-like nuclease [Novosphingobium capsulatum]WQD92859.1 MAE_28990/MAE_18760 family HEPN-like nuclease [Novosphingobium capsulatum]
MSKPYSEADFSAQVTEDRNWRMKEISDLKSAIRQGDEGARRVLLRALITICYAHWEGYVRFAAKKYLEHVALRKFQYSQLGPQFFKNYFLPRLSSINSGKLSISERCALVEEILSSSDRRFSRVNEDLINTRANLNFEVFSDICVVCGVADKPFSDKSNFIDVMLLKRRNAIAHGEETLIDLRDLDEVANGTISLMRAFGDSLENHVVLQTYKAA